MNTISLRTYTLRLTHKDVTNNLRLDQIYDYVNEKEKKIAEARYKEIDAFIIIESFLNNLITNYSVDEDAKKIFRVGNCVIDEDERLISGIIQTGDYGYETELVDTDSGAVSYKRKTSDAEVMPFYFLIYNPKEKDEGCVILQEFKGFGIKTPFLKYIRECFCSENENFVINMFPLVPEQLIRELFSKGEPKKLRYIKFGINRDIADVENDHKEDEYNIELSISAKRNKYFQIRDEICDSISNCKPLDEIMGHFRDKDKFDRVIELHDFEYDIVKLQLSINGTPKIIDLSNPYKLRPIHNITDEVEIGVDQHPIFESIDKIAKDLLKMYTDAMSELSGRT
jgi:hypothetical protein